MVEFSPTFTHQNPGITSVDCVKSRTNIYSTSCWISIGKKGQRNYIRYLFGIGPLYCSSHFCKLETQHVLLSLRSQLKNDLWRLEQWVQYAESVLASLPTSPPHQMELLADAIQEHRDLLLDLDCHNNLLVSLSSMHDQLDDDSSARLDTINRNWPGLTERAAGWQLSLQTALSQVSVISTLMIILLLIFIHMYIVYKYYVCYPNTNRTDWNCGEI